MTRLCIILTLALCCSRIIAQHAFDADRWKVYLDEMAADSEDASGMDELADELSRIADKPMNLNRTTTDELKRLPFLSNEQIRSIISHRIKYGYMMSIYELKDVEGLDLPTIELLLPFVYVPQQADDERFAFTAKNIIRRSKHDVQIRFDRCLQTKEGYRPLPADSVAKLPDNKRYLGEPFYHSLKYSYSFGNKILAGIAAEKDAGEPFRKGYDFYSFHILLKDIKWMQTIALGDYKATFGQGLAMGYGGFPALMPSLTDAERRSSGFARHGSTSEYGFLRGGAITAKMDNIRLSAFYSYRKLDATIADSAATSIKTDGLHRLPRDIEKSRRLNMQTLGANLTYDIRRFSAGMTIVSNAFLNYPLMPQLKLYNIHHFRGHSNLNLSMDYRIQHHRLTFYGETAMSANKSMATLNALLYTPPGNISFLALHRHYDKAYQAFFSNAFAQNTSAQNEQGLYVAARFSPSKTLKIAASADRFAMRWPAYDIDAPSQGTEYALQIDYVNPSAASFYFKYKYRQKEKNHSSAASITPDIIDYATRRLRINARYSLHDLKLDFHTSASAAFYEEGNVRNRGLLLSHRTDWTPSALPLSVSIYAAIFDTDGYTTNLTTGEKNMPYTYGFNRVYGKGLRLALLARWNIRSGTALHLKAGDTNYAEGDEIGSDLETISGRRKTDIQILLRQTF
ncbi:MAG: helix-hairpin-helix domain-containing protein [Tannerellaceae bacterium]|jgi:hypothetical protein|nr:helix-hairpin-helix domain-containing protein [Tannerellaceae bacterium]